jgi:hypothetical protein
MTGRSSGRRALGPTRATNPRKIMTGSGLESRQTCGTTFCISARTAFRMTTPSENLRLAGVHSGFAVIPRTGNVLGRGRGPYGRGHRASSVMMRRCRHSCRWWRLCWPSSRPHRRARERGDRARASLGLGVGSTGEGAPPVRPATEAATAHEPALWRGRWSPPPADVGRWGAPAIRVVARLGVHAHALGGNGAQARGWERHRALRRLSAALRGDTRAAATAAQLLSKVWERRWL